MALTDFFKPKNDFKGTFNKESKIIRRVLKGNTITVDSPSSVRFYNKSDGSDGFVTGQLGFDKNTNNDGGQTVYLPSTAVEKYSYDPNAQELLVWFKGNSSNAYSFICPPEVVDDFTRSSSKGRFVNSVLKKYYHDPRY